MSDCKDNKKEQQEQPATKSQGKCGCGCTPPVKK